MWYLALTLLCWLVVTTISSSLQADPRNPCWLHARFFASADRIDTEFREPFWRGVCPAVKARHQKLINRLTLRGDGYVVVIIPPREGGWMVFQYAWLSTRARFGSQLVAVTVRQDHGV